MSNRSYQRGIKVERELVNLGRAHGWKAWRSAGSKSDIDVTWVREKGKLRGTVMEALELIRTNGWAAEPTTKEAPDFFLYGFFRFLRNMSKHYIWVRAADDGMTHSVYIQCKTKLGKKP